MGQACYKMYFALVGWEACRSHKSKSVQAKQIRRNP